MPLKNFAIITLVVCGVLLGCGKADPIINVKNSPIVASPGNKNMRNIKRAIVLAGTRIGWQMQATSPGHIVGTVFRGGHMAKVDIDYSTDKYSINYKDSSNLGYNGETIHNTYNRWVNDLHKHIRKGLARLK